LKNGKKGRGVPIVEKRKTDSDTDTDTDPDGNSFCVDVRTAVTGRERGITEMEGRPQKRSTFKRSTFKRFFIATAKGKCGQGPQSARCA
jgi:hypothetical protein